MSSLTSALPIRLENVSIRIGGVNLLDQVSLVLEPGRPTLLIGPNGSGKTTLLRAAMGLIQPSHGRITWGDHTEAPVEKLAIVLQRPVMLRRSVAANIRYALKAARIAKETHEKRIADLLALVGLSDIAGRPARRLSGGEQQRLAIARAIAREPDVLLLDEPTSSLDPASTKSIEDLIRLIANGGTKIVMATHDLSEARRLAGAIVLLHRGSVAETGEAQAFFSAPQTGEAKAFLGGELLL